MGTALAVQLLTHKSLNPDPIVLHQQKTSQSRGAAHGGSTNSTSSFISNSWKNLFLDKIEELLSLMPATALTREGGN